MPKPKYEISATNADGTPHIDVIGQALGKTEATRAAVYSDTELAERQAAADKAGATLHIRKL
jgi:hypothetical protein